MKNDRNALLSIMLCASTSAACGSDDASPPSAGTPSATANITGFSGGTVSGSAKFTQLGSDVTVSITLNGCTDTKTYPTHIHEGKSCTDVASQGDHWGPTRGEGIPNIQCSGTTGSSQHTRKATPAETAWSIGGDATTNVVGHVIVVHDPDVPMSPPRIACGVIAQ